MSEMVERVAKAMEPGAFATYDRGFTAMNAIEQRAFLNAEKVVKRARKKARAAIEAMRGNPTLEMQIRGMEALCLYNIQTDGPAKPHDECKTPDDWMARGANIAGRMQSGAGVSCVFDAMLDAAIPASLPVGENK